MRRIVTARRAAFGAVALAVSLSLASACHSSASNADGGAGSAFVERFPLHQAGFDLLFMIDNSLGMSVVQAKFIQAIPAFFGALDALPGGRPDLHIAVVSSDMGAGPFDNIPQCHPGGDQGLFKSARAGNCTTTGLADGQHFISSVGGVNNFDPARNLVDVFSCIAPLGGDGCSFEHQLASVTRALGADKSLAPIENAGFLRPNADLAIVLLSDEDDCSAPPDSAIFDPTSRLVTDRYGPLASYRCNEYGHLCGGRHPPRTMDADFGDTCRSAEDGVLLRLSDVRAGLTALKDDPSRVSLFVIAGPPAPYQVRLVAPSLKEDPNLWPEVEHSCITADGLYADPGVRLAQLADSFGPQGESFPLCADTLDPALQEIAARLGEQTMGCVRAPPPGIDPSAPTDPVGCQVLLETGVGQGVRQTALPACPVADGSSCYTLAPNAACKASGLSLQVTGTTPGVNQGTLVLRCPR